MPPSRLDEVLAVGMLAAPEAERAAAGSGSAAIASMTMLMYEKSCLLDALRPLTPTPTHFVDNTAPRWNAGVMHIPTDPNDTFPAFEQHRDRRNRLLERLKEVERDLATFAEALMPGFGAAIQGLVAKEPLPYAAFEQAGLPRRDSYDEYVAKFRAGTDDYPYTPPSFL